MSAGAGAGMLGALGLSGAVGMPRTSGMLLGGSTLPGTNGVGAGRSTPGSVSEGDASGVGIAFSAGSGCGAKGLVSGAGATCAGCGGAG